MRIQHESTRDRTRRPTDATTACDAARQAGRVGVLDPPRKKRWSKKRARSWRPCIHQLTSRAWSAAPAHLFSTVLKKTHQVDLVPIDPSPEATGIHQSAAARANCGELPAGWHSCRQTGSLHTCTTDGHRVEVDLLDRQQNTCVRQLVPQGAEPYDQPPRLRSGHSSGNHRWSIVRPDRPSLGLENEREVSTTCARPHPYAATAATRALLQSLKF